MMHVHVQSCRFACLTYLSWPFATAVALVVATASWVDSLRFSFPDTIHVSYSSTLCISSQSDFIYV